MDSSPILIPQIAIHPSYITTYSEVHWTHGKPVRYESIEQKEIKSPEFSHLLKSSRTSNGKVSDIAKRKVKKATEYLLLMANNKSVTSRYTGRKLQFKICFITLTLPSKQIHSDKEIKEKCLNSLLIELTRYYKVKNYIWRAEKQKNGNIHFHILTDKFIDWNELRNRWNRIVNKLGYVDRYRESQKNFHKNGFHVRTELLPSWSYERQLKAYEEGVKNHWDNPNSTDIHSVRKIINLKNYILKYMIKEVELTANYIDKIQTIKLKIKNCKAAVNRKKLIRNLKRLTQSWKKYKKKNLVKGRIWSCNQSLSNIKGCQLDRTDNLRDELYQILEKSQCYTIHDPYYDIYFIAFHEIGKLGGKELFKKFCQYLVDKFGYHYQLATDQ
jgi:hypothetical protein